MGRPRHPHCHPHRHPRGSPPSLVFEATNSRGRCLTTRIRKTSRRKRVLTYERWWKRL
ncbi:hypothetical protein AXX17_AT1G19110 [Arabidopsis thaliana]|uniref:Uncharacterized protein n=1 Tax=Arabidopsis thaliana TaxID=3702 RepID=A0A178WDV0_ARATH|nr:hypothetical protein AXX17_AT1G19110 [Arabidopsis thaliana]